MQARTVPVVVLATLALLSFAPQAGAVVTLGPPITASQTLGIISAPFRLAAADVDQDGAADLISTMNGVQNVAGYDVIAFKNLARDGSLTSFGYPLLGSPIGATPSVGRLDPGPSPDLVLGGDLTTFQVLLNNGSGGFPSASAVTPVSPCTVTGIGQAAIRTALGDMTGDGLDDLAVLYSGGSGPLCLYRNPGNGNFGSVTPTVLPIPASTVDVALRDVNGDGRADAVTTAVPASVSVWLNNGSGGFPASPTSTNALVGTGPFPTVTVADVTGDGKQDLVVGNYFGAAGTIKIGVGDGTGSFGFSATTATIPQGTSNFATLTVGDLSLDGRPDIAVSNGSALEVYENTGSGPFPFPTAPQDITGITGGPKDIALGDYNADGVLDVASVGNNFEVRLNTATRALYATPAAPAFPDQALGTLGPAQSMTLTNTGNSVLRVSVASASGDFLKTGDTCTGAAVPGGQSCTIAVRFAPTALGLRTGALSITDNTVAGTHSVALAGTGIALPQGPKGDSGGAGPPAAPGPAGPRGPAGRDAAVVCTAGKARKGRVKVTCAVKLKAARTAVRARLSRHGRTVAAASVRQDGSVRFRFGRRPRAGRYVLTVVSVDTRDHVVLTTTTVVLR